MWWWFNPVILLWTWTKCFLLRMNDDDNELNTGTAASETLSKHQHTYIQNHKQTHFLLRSWTEWPAVISEQPKTDKFHWLLRSMLILTTSPNSTTSDEDKSYAPPQLPSEFGFLKAILKWHNSWLVTLTMMMMWTYSKPKQNQQQQKIHLKRSPAQSQWLGPPFSRYNSTTTTTLHAIFWSFLLLLLLQYLTSFETISQLLSPL